MAEHRHLNFKDRRGRRGAQQMLIALIAWMGHQSDTCRKKLRPRGVDNNVFLV